MSLVNGFRQLYSKKRTTLISLSKAELDLLKSLVYLQKLEDDLVAIELYAKLVRARRELQMYEPESEQR